MNDDDKKREIGNRLQRARRAKNFSQGKLAGKADVDSGTISRIELGKSNPDRATCEALADVLEVDVTWLMVLDDPAAIDRDEDDPNYASPELKAAIEAYLVSPDGSDTSTSAEYHLRRADWYHLGFEGDVPNHYDIHEFRLSIERHLRRRAG